jgi:hypothetical protein
MMGPDQNDVRVAYESLWCWTPLKWMKFIPKYPCSVLVWVHSTSLCKTYCQKGQRKEQGRYQTQLLHALVLVGTYD